MSSYLESGIKLEAKPDVIQEIGKWSLAIGAAFVVGGAVAAAAFFAPAAFTAITLLGLPAEALVS